MAADVEDSQAKIEALTAVTENYSGTTSALWAKVNAAHEMMNTDQKQAALNAYTEIRDEIDASSLLYPLVTIGLAQAHASIGNFDASAVEYEKLKDIEGYDDVGYFGLARINEERGDFPKALSIYEEYLETLTNVSERNQKALVEEKIARIKASL
jgi:tetratricopeptide (TPR) repeat protein